jgi:general secretion pathway protein D
VIEAANAVRGVLHLRTISWDSVANTVVIRDQMSKARIAESLLDALLLPHGQLSLEVQFLAVDTSSAYEYGAVLQNSISLFNFAHIGGFAHPLPDLTGVANLLVFGGGTNFFGLALTSASLIATYNSSSSKVLYDATVVVSEGQTATLHVGEKYPIANALFTGFSGSSSALANPISTTQEDLGLVLKMAGRVNGDGDITIDAEAQYKSLGNQTFNTVPAINQREFKGTVRLREGECAIIAGMQENDRSVSKNGIIGLSEIPILEQIFSDNSRSHVTSDTLIVIKPTVTRLPMSDLISPQFLLGAERGVRVLL